MYMSIDWMLIAIGNSLFIDDTSYKCIKSVYLIVNDGLGAAYLLCHSIFVFMFSLLIWYIFYRIPEKYGLLKSAVADRLTVRSYKAKNNIPIVSPTQLNLNT